MKTTDEKFPTPRQTRIGFLVILPLALLFGQRALVWADVTLPTTFTDGKPLTAKQLTDNFNALKDAVNKPTIEKNGKSYSMNATFCGATTDQFVGDFGASTYPGYGYAKAAEFCAAVSGCGAGAHLCTPDELTRSMALGIQPVPQGGSNIRVASGVYMSSNTTSYDCGGYTEKTDPYRGGGWTTKGPIDVPCSAPAALACCR